MKKKVCFLSLLFCAIFLLTAQAEEVITSQLRNEMELHDDSRFLPVNITLIQRLDPEELLPDRSYSKTESRIALIKELKGFHQSAQREVIEELNGLAAQNQAEEIKSLWIANVVNCRIRNDKITQLTMLPNIDSIDLDEKRNMLLAEDLKTDLSDLRFHRNFRDTTWNVSLVQADQVWDLGYTGQNVTVAVLDTGVNYNHRDLRDHLWEHEDYPFHGYDFVNDDYDPMDDNGHGTHCAGTVAGDGSAGTITGMAPDALIMCIKMLDSGGGGSEFNSWQAIQFGVEMGADILSMSFGWQHLYGVNRRIWREVMVNTLYAGTIASVAAGNEGQLLQAYPIPDNIRTPGDCPPPWLHPDQTITGGISSVVCVGATDCDDRLAAFSGRGPVTWEEIYPWFDYPYDPEIGLIRPDILAPGVDITSLAYDDDMGYESGWDGTSMATPCVAGIMALMLSKNQALLPYEIDQIIEQTVDIPQDPKNSEYGSGRINALNAVNSVSEWDQPPLAAYFPQPAHLGFDVPPSTSLYWMNGGGSDYYLVYFGTDNPPTNILNGEMTGQNYFNLPQILELDTDYFWRVDSYNTLGDAGGDLWQFRTIEPADEDFETGDFSAYDWGFLGDADWIIDDQECFYGNFSARSGVIGHDQQSGLKLDMDLQEPDTLSFFIRTSCQLPMNDYFTDKVTFCIDGEVITVTCGETDWNREIIIIPEGIHEISWIYQKDGDTSVGDDCTWIDFVNFPEFSNVDPGILEGSVSLCPEGDLSLVYLMVDQEYIVLDENGFFSVSLDHGYYDITAGCEGYENYYCEDLYIPPGETVTLDIILNGMLPPSGLEAELTGSTVCLNWNPPLPEQRPLLYYSIYRNFDYGDFSFILATTNNTCEDELEEDGTYGYYVTSVYNDGESCPSDTVYVTMVPAGNNTVPEKSVFLGNRPNPFNPETSFRFYLQQEAQTKLEIYNLKGERIRLLTDEIYDPGFHNLIWDGKSDEGDSVPSGIYFVRFNSDKVKEFQKIIMLK